MVNIPAIEEFLQRWRKRAEDYYMKLKEDYLKLYHAEYPVNEEDYSTYLKNPPRYGLKVGAKNFVELNQWEIEKISSYKKSKTIENFLNPLTGKGAELVKYYTFCGYEEKLKKMLDSEVTSKRKTLTTRVQEKAGDIKDARNLTIGVNGELNGYIIGSKGNVRVQTIYAGGYNIQCLHYRVLVN